MMWRTVLEGRQLDAVVLGKAARVYSTGGGNGGGVGGGGGGGGGGSGSGGGGSSLAGWCMRL